MKRSRKEFWNGDALGKRLDERRSGRRRGRQQVLDAWRNHPATGLYGLARSGPRRTSRVYVRTSDVAGAPAKALRTEIARLDPSKVRRCAALMTDTMSAGHSCPRKRGRSLTGGFGMLGALLAMMGIYGLVAFSVATAQRARSASAKRSAPQHPTSSGSSSPGGANAIGATVLWPALVSARSAPSASAASSSGVSPIDPLTMLGTTVLVVGTTLAASVDGPALRAARVVSVEGAEDGVGTAQGSGLRAQAQAQAQAEIFDVVEGFASFLMNKQRERAEASEPRERSGASGPPRAPAFAPKALRRGLAVALAEAEAQ